MIDERWSSDKGGPPNKPAAEAANVHSSKAARVHSTEAATKATAKATKPRKCPN